MPLTSSEAIRLGIAAVVLVLATITLMAVTNDGAGREALLLGRITCLEAGYGQAIVWAGGGNVTCMDFFSGKTAVMPLGNYTELAASGEMCNCIMLVTNTGRGCMC